MPDQSTTRTPSDERAPKKHRSGGRNPVNVPARHLDASLPQPSAPERSEVDSQQDRQPVEPEPVLERVEEEGGKERELRNG